MSESMKGIVISEQRKENPVKQIPETFKNLETHLSRLSVEIKEEILEIWSKLSVETQQAIVDKMRGVESKTQRRFQDDELQSIYEQHGREFRLRFGDFTREDLRGVDEVSLELYFYDVLTKMTRMIHNSTISMIYARDELSVQKSIDSLLDPVWENRGKSKDEMVYPGNQDFSKKEAQLEALQKQAADVKARYLAIVEKWGKKQRRPNDVDQKIGELSKEYTDLTGNAFMSLDGKLTGTETRVNIYNSKITKLVAELKEDRLIAKERVRLWMALIYLAEHFSAEDLSIITYDYFMTDIDRLTRRDKNANPEILDFLVSSIQKWADKHKGQEAIYKKQKMVNSQKAEILITQFIERLNSFNRHVDSAAISRKMKDANEKELTVPLGILSRISS